MSISKEQRDYNHLHNVSKEARTLSGIVSLLDWDQETYMPADGAGIRAEQLKTLAGIVHAKKTGRPFSSALSKLINIETGEVLALTLTPQQQAALKEWRRDYRIEKALPKRFVEEIAVVTSKSMHAWRHARQQNAFHQFAPFLEKIVVLMRKKAEYLGYAAHPYDALLDHYEHGTTTVEMTSIFNHLRSTLTPLIKKITSKQQTDDSFLFGEFSTAKQMEFSHVLLKALHYDMARGRLDFSTHPFSSSCHPTDSRITTRIHPTGLMSNITAVLHETGHALYEMGLPTEEYGSPLGEAISLGMHESQSRWWETLIGHSKPFWHYFLPLLKTHFKKQLDHISLDEFYRAINKVKPSYIRIESDEVTYNLHVALRFEIERSLIEGKLAVRDLPDAWNAELKNLLGLPTPPTNREGCLQDIHWSMGAFGYFPTYTLGNLYASQLFAGFAIEFPKWEERVATGELGFIKEWLSEAVYKQGRRYSSKELVKNVVGKPFSAEPFINYLTKKYTNL